MKNSTLKLLFFNIGHVLLRYIFLDELVDLIHLLFFYPRLYLVLLSLHSNSLLDFIPSLLFADLLP